MNTFALRTAALVTIAIAIVLSSFTTTAAQEVSVTPVTIAQGATGKVELAVSDIAAPGLGAWHIDVLYNPAIVTPISCASHPSGVCNPLFADGVVRAVGATASGLAGDTTLASISFECKSVGSTALTVVVRDLSDATAGDLQPIAAEVSHGGAFCLDQAPPPATPPPTGGVLGDVDCDGIVTSIDAQLILQLGGALIISLPCEENGDVNGDGFINALDAQLILQFVVGFITSLG